MDYFVVGAGAVADTSTATANIGLVPNGSLAFQFAGAGGFAHVAISHANAPQPGLFTLTFYNQAGTSIYSFSKANPRTAPGHVVGNIGAPPGPTPLNEYAGSGGPMVIISGIFIAIAVCMGAWIVASHCLATMGLRPGGGGASRPPPHGGAADERTPLVLVKL